MSGVWDTYGRIQESLSKYKQTSGPFNSDGKLKFGLMSDLAKNIPDNPRYYSKTIAEAERQLSASNSNSGGVNNFVEKGRQGFLEGAQATLGKPLGIPALAATGAGLGSVVPGFGTAVGAGVGAATGTVFYGIAELDKKNRWKS